MNDYAIGRCSRRCKVSDRLLEPGERFYSVAVAKGGEIIRFDVAESHWEGPPADAVGWWRGTMAPARPQQRMPTPNHHLVEILGRLCDDPSQSAIAYLLAVLLVRRKVLEVVSDEDEDSAIQLTVVHPLTEQRFVVPAIEPEAAALAEVQESLQALLFSEG